MDTEQAFAIAEGVVKPSDDRVILEAWQYLIDTNLVWDMGSYYHSTAAWLIREKMCHG